MYCLAQFAILRFRDILRSVLAFAAPLDDVQNSSPKRIARPGLALMTNLRYDAQLD
jgi:hypothetical protein